MTDFFFAGLRCNSCDYGFFNLSRDYPDGCQSCGCNPFGSIDPYCDTVTGQCMCKERVTGLQCNRCSEGYQDLHVGCVPCDCDAKGDLTRHSDLSLDNKDVAVRISYSPRRHIDSIK